MNTHPLIAKVHTAFKDIRYELSTFFDNRDHDLIRFQFGETPSYFQFRVKFTSTLKVIKFIVYKDNDHCIEVTKLEKTQDIVTDIDEIYKTVGNSNIDYERMTGVFTGLMTNLFVWGIRRNRDRKNDVFRVQAAKLPDWEEGAIIPVMDNRTLYYDIVTNFEVEEDNPEKPTITVRLDLLFTQPYIIDCSREYMENVKVGRLLIVNFLQRYNLLSFTSAKHHLNFTPEQFNEISTYLSTRREMENTHGHEKIAA